MFLERVLEEGKKSLQVALIQIFIDLINDWFSLSRIACPRLILVCKIVQRSWREAL